MIYADVCAGISAATVAWKPLGWRAAFYSEIDKFPSAVLAHHYPDTPNLGDMTRYDEWPDAALDVLIGGTPCQGFSVAGQRKGLDDPRSNLALCFGKIAERYQPRWIVWENVPGVRSANEGRDLGAFLRGLAELGYGLAWRSLDAQYSGLAQRRERLFLVGHLGDWRPAAAVLLEPEGLRWDSAPSREAGEGTAGATASGVALRGREGGGTAELTGDIATAMRASQGGGDKPHVLTASPLMAKDGRGVHSDMDTFIAHSLRAEGFDASEDGTGRGTPIVPIAFHSVDHGADAVHDLSPTIRRHDPTAIAFSCKDHGADAGDLSPTLRAMTERDSTPNGGGQVAVAFTGDPYRYGPSNQDTMHFPDGVLNTLPQGTHDNAGHYTKLFTGWAVRRLTPRECERLQGFPDDYTRIAWRGKPADQCPDGPRYKALGNSIAVPCLRWIGERIALCEEAMSELRRVAA